MGRSKHAPPPRHLWPVLSNPLGDHRWRWLNLQPDEQEPAVLAGSAPTDLIWGSLWPAQPRVQVRFAIEPDGAGSLIRWSLLAPVGSLGPEEAEACRYRISYLLNDRDGLRGVFGQ